MTTDPITKLTVALISDRILHLSKELGLITELVNQVENRQTKRHLRLGSELLEQAIGQLKAAVYEEMSTPTDDELARASAQMAAQVIGRKGRARVESQPQ